MDYIEEKQGSLLALSWPQQKQNNRLRKNLLRSLSRIMLSLGRPFDRIGSLTIDDLGRVGLTNRPLTLRLPVLENEGIPANIPRHRCYSNVHSYLFDLLTYQDSRLEHQPNSVRDKYDAEAQMAVLTIMRSIIPDFFQEALREGPFIFRATDMRPHNIFVDEDYNITSLIDNEWACSLPVETDHPPFWLSGHELDELEGDAVKDFDQMAYEFMEIFEEEEMNMFGIKSVGFSSRTGIMRRALERRTHWCMATLNEPKGMYNMFLEHIQPLYAPSHQSERELAIKFQEIVAPYWKVNHTDFINAKLRQREEYLNELRWKFEDTQGS